MIAGLLLQLVVLLAFIYAGGIIAVAIALSVSELATARRRAKYGMGPSPFAMSTWQVIGRSALWPVSAWAALYRIASRTLEPSEKPGESLKNRLVVHHACTECGARLVPPVASRSGYAPCPVCQVRP